MIASIGSGAFLLGAGAVAAFIGTAGGITSLVSYPALLLVGLPRLDANIANIVAVVACLPGSAIASRPELAHERSFVIRWALIAIAGGVLGSVLLLTTPRSLFGSIVPWLIASAALVLLLQPWIARRTEAHRVRLRPPTLPLILFAFSVYNGYFGAGSSVMIIALLMLGRGLRITVANAIKNMLVGISSAFSALIFALTATVHWAYVVPLAAGMLGGSLVGPMAARRVQQDVLRIGVALLGFVLAAELWLHSQL